MEKGRMVDEGAVPEEKIHRTELGCLVGSLPFWGQ